MSRSTKLSRLVLVPLAIAALAAYAQSDETPQATGAAPAASATPAADVLADWRNDAPGHRLHIRATDVPAPETGNDPEKSIAGNVAVVDPPADALPRVPACAPGAPPPIPRGPSPSASAPPRSCRGWRR